MVPEKFQHILRVMNTNVDGRRKIMFALTAIKVRFFFSFFFFFFIILIYSILPRMSTSENKYPIPSKKWDVSTKTGSGDA